MPIELVQAKGVSDALSYADVINVKENCTYVYFRFFLFDLPATVFILRLVLSIFKNKMCSHDIIYLNYSYLTLFLEVLGYKVYK